eukprot:386226-Amphidinium_carterae.1
MCRHCLLLARLTNKRAGSCESELRCEGQTVLIRFRVGQHVQLRTSLTATKCAEVRVVVCSRACSHQVIYESSWPGPSLRVLCYHELWLSSC